MRVGRHDPGDCLICGAAHCSCGGSDTIEVVQLPARDAAVALALAPAALEQLGDGSDGRSFSTATYRGTKKPR